MIITRDARVRILKQGDGIWRTVVRDDLSGWGITGPPYPTKAEALIVVDQVASEYYGPPKILKPRG